ncbi:MAG: hypothetical protein QXK89_01490 [Candidatus Bathyarchaeia archaeon]
MVKFRIVPGKKGPGDKLIKIWADGDVLTIRDMLLILKNMFEAEDALYPISRGKQGRALILKAILDVYSGIPLERVLEAYGLSGRPKPKAQAVGLPIERRVN